MCPWWIQLLNHAIDTTGQPDCCAYCSLLITCWVIQHSTLQLCIVVSFLDGWTLILVFSSFQNWIEDMWCVLHEKHTCICFCACTRWILSFLSHVVSYVTLLSTCFACYLWLGFCLLFFKNFLFSQVPLQEIKMMQVNFKRILLLASQGAHFADLEFQSHHICPIE